MPVLPRSYEEGHRQASRRSFGAPASLPAQYESNFMALLSMRLPQHLLTNPFFQFSRIEELLAALSGEISHAEVVEIHRLHALNLPPITSVETLSAMFGINPGLARSLLNRKERYYRYFKIPKGNTFRIIQAPRIALKIIQKWISVRLSCAWLPNECLYGFVPGRSHVDAAARHGGAEWVFSCDVENFFPSTPEAFVASALKGVGYGDGSADLIASLCCCDGGLAQGSPASPILSNICATGLDKALISVKDKYNCTYTRYADDIVLSGKGEFPVGIDQEALHCFIDTPWSISERKTKISVLPDRLKVHGLLVDQAVPRLTKGYRNKIRAYRHLVKSNKITENASAIRGHIAYADFVEAHAKQN